MKILYQPTCNQVRDLCRFFSVHNFSDPAEVLTRALIRAKPVKQKPLVKDQWRTRARDSILNKPIPANTSQWNIR